MKYQPRAQTYANYLLEVGNKFYDIGDKQTAAICYKKANQTNPAELGTIPIANSRIIEVDPNYDSRKVTQKGNCYVATAVYGSYDCPEVWTLRRYRDYTLAETWYGRAFIRTYYAISPTIVKWFGKTEWFKNMWKPTLDKMVKKLNNNGVDNTAYNDRKW